MHASTPTAEPTPTHRILVLGSDDFGAQIISAIGDRKEFHAIVRTSLRDRPAGDELHTTSVVLVSADFASAHRQRLFPPGTPPRVVVCSENPDIEQAVHWMRQGAADFLALDRTGAKRLPTRLLDLIGHAPPAPPTTGRERRALMAARQLAAITESVGEGLLLVDEQGRIAVFNRKLRRISGFSRSLTPTLREFLPSIHPDPGELRRVEDRAEEAAATGEKREVETSARTRQGNTILVAITFNPVPVAGRRWLLAVFRDITGARRNEAALELREARSKLLTNALASLTADERLFHSDRGTALRLVTSVAAQALGVARVGVWFLEAEGTVLRCHDCFEQPTGAHRPPAQLAATDFPEYFDALRSRRIIAAGDAAHDPATHRLATATLTAEGVGAVLDAPIRGGGSIVGAVRCEHLGPSRAWTAAEQSFASAIGGCVSLILEADARLAAQTALKAANSRLNDIIEFLPDATFVIDTRGVVTAWNKAMETLTGVPKARVLGRGDHEYALPIHGIRRPILIDLALRADPDVTATYDNFRSEGRTVSGEMRRTPPGTDREIYLWGSARPLFDQDGRTTGAIESIRDITQRRQAENEITAWKKRYEIVAVASGQITYELSLETGFILWGDTVGQVLGYPLAEMGGTLLRWLRLIHPEDRRRALAYLHRCLRTGTPFDFEYRMRRHDGSHLWFRDRGYYIDDPGGAKCMVGMLTDVTAAHEAAEELRKAHLLLEDRVRERTEELGQTNRRLREEIAERERAQQNLAASEQKYRLMVDSLPQVVYELDLRGNLLVVNREGIKAGRFTPEDVRLGINLFSMVHPDDHARLRANWGRILAGHTVGGEEYCFVRRDGTTFHGTSYAHLIVRDGQPVGVTGFLIDETDRRAAAETLRRAHADLEDRVVQRTAELAESNASLRRLLEKQEMNIGLAHQVLLLVNAEQPRNTSLPEGRRLFTAAQSIPRHLEGGDHFFARHLADDQGSRTLVSIKDQSGHEVGCILRSIITDLIHNALVGPAGARRSLAEVTTQLNREICRSHLFQDGDFFTAINLEIDHATLRMSYLVAGHPPFLLVRGNTVQLIPSIAAEGTNLPVGMIDHHQFSAASLQLEPGDKIILYTDGLLELPATRQQPHLSSQTLVALVRDLVAREPRLHVVRLAQRLFETAAGITCEQAVDIRQFPDDVALFCIEIELPPTVFEDCIRPASIADLRDKRAQLSAKIGEEWRDHGVTAAPMRLHMVLEEALYNAWRHGNRRNPEKGIVVRRSYGNDACIEIIDEGDGFQWEEVGDPTAHENRTKPSGRGLFMIRRFADEARWSDRGRHLTLHFGDEKTFRPVSGRSPLPRLDLWNSPHLSPSIRSMP